VEAVAAVAREDLVAAIAGQGHRDVAPGQGAHGQRRDGGVVSERLAENSRLAARRGDVVRRGALLVVAGAMTGGDGRGERALIGETLEADGEALDPADAARREGGDGAGVQSAGQEAAERDVRHQPGAHRQVEAVGQLGRRVARCRGGADGRPPVGAGLWRGGVAAAEQKRMRRRQAPDGGVDRGRIGHVAERQEIVDGCRVEAARYAGQRQQGRDLGCEGPAAIGQARIVQRLLAQAVAREQELATNPVPQGEREHPVQAVQHADAPGPPAEQDRLRVGAGKEAVALGLELTSEVGMVVDLPVEGDHHFAIGRRHRLGAASEVDDREATMAEAHMRLRMKALAIGTAMADRIGHPTKLALIRDGRVHAMKKADDAAHALLLLFRLK
jgi:hypothetical protein